MRARMACCKRARMRRAFLLCFTSPPGFFIEPKAFEIGDCGGKEVQPKLFFQIKVGCRRRKRNKDSFHTAPTVALREENNKGDNHEEVFAMVLGLALVLGLASIASAEFAITGQFVVKGVYNLDAEESLPGAVSTTRFELKFTATYETLSARL